MSAENYIKLRGLPWNAAAKEIIEFLKDVEIVNGENGIHMITSPRDGRPNGECYVECATKTDYDNAFEYNKKMMGHRYIEIFAAKEEDLEYTLRKKTVVQQETFIKLRGLPYDCSLGDIDNFFDGLELKNGRDSIHICLDNRGRATGEAFVQFGTTEEAEKALEKNRDKIGHRYIELFRSTANEFRRVKNNNGSSPFDRDNSRGGSPGGRGGMMRDRSPGGWSGNRGGFGNGGGGFNSNFDDNFGNNRNNRFGGGNNGGGGGNGYGFGNSFNSRNDNFRNDNFGNNNFGGNSMGMGNGYGRNNTGGGGNGFSSGGNNRGKEFRVHLRGMPYDCDEKDVYDFFKPLKPMHVDVIFNSRDRPSGEADVFFDSLDEAEEAMSKNKNTMGSRYIELFLKTEGGFNR